MPHFHLVLLLAAVVMLANFVYILRVAANLNLERNYIFTLTMRESKER